MWLMVISCQTEHNPTSRQDVQWSLQLSDNIIMKDFAKFRR